LNASDSLPKGFIVKGSGYSEDIDIILREMDLQLPEVHDDFVEASVNEQSLSLSSIAVAEKVMPSVKNMGLRDALYLLEKQGLNVQVIGKGKVKYQSIPAGQSIRKGLEVTIRLG
jgi:cell division protein FtsI (penicillin-binding protein 3)